MNDLKEKLQEYLDNSTPEELRAEIAKREHLQRGLGYFHLQFPDRAPLPKDQPAIYLAGGITPGNWQAYVTNRLRGFGNITIINPRNEAFDGSFEAVRAGTKWEHFYLDQADQIVFWFDYLSNQPVSMFELGARLREYKHRNYVKGPKPQPMFIGCHPKFLNKYDVFEQARMEGYTSEIVNNLDDLVDNVLEFNRLKQLIS